MRAKSIFVSATVLAASTLVAVNAHAGDHRGGASAFTPGHEMQAANPTGHGASDYTPGDQMRDLREQSTTTTTATTATGSTEPGASGFAPGDNGSHGRK